MKVSEIEFNIKLMIQMQCLLVSYLYHSISNIIFSVLGIGIFNSDGEQWRTQRKLASHMFSLNNFKDLQMPVFVHHAEMVMDEIRNSKGGIVDVSDLTARYTLDSICEVQITCIL